LRDKIAAAVGQYIPSMVTRNPAHATPAVILFTSGTEGEPKGVALSHLNLLSNVEQVRSHIAIYPSDVLFNPLPTFHCFGLTVGALMPLYLGIKAVFHPTPLQPHEIVRRIRASGSTILLSTDTFISQYARAGEQGDLNSLRLAVCGAERLRDETRALFRKKYAIELLEGYGVTEGSPVVAANQPGANRPGTVGRLMQGLKSRLEPVEGIPNAGRLFIHGPNIMLGYIKADQPGIIQPPPGGWHDTGDVVSIDEEGFIAIKGRMKRFAKIGGEIVSLAVVENVASALWPDHAHAALAIPDTRKGEQILLVTTNADAKRHDLVGWAQNHGVPEIAVPRRILYADHVPVLGTGKTDYTKVQAMVCEQLETDAQAAS
jgi:acyl-[acyl-carrier-protein]-phospholipid O-acyltransferase/long-chain-fatty-acid--[acyl-carrier-protein] ligase